MLVNLLLMLLSTLHVQPDCKPVIIYNIPFFLHHSKNKSNTNLTPTYFPKLPQFSLPHPIDTYIFAHHPYLKLFLKLSPYCARRIQSCLIYILQLSLTLVPVSARLDFLYRQNNSYDPVTWMHIEEYQAHLPYWDAASWILMKKLFPTSSINSQLNDSTEILLSFSNVHVYTHTI